MADRLLPQGRFGHLPEPPHQEPPLLSDGSRPLPRGLPAAAAFPARAVPATSRQKSHALYSSLTNSKLPTETAVLRRQTATPFPAESSACGKGVFFIRIVTVQGTR